MRRFNYLLLLVWLIGFGLIYFLLSSSTEPPWQCLAEPFHQLIEPYPTPDSMCAGHLTDEPASMKRRYRLDLRIVTVLYGRGPSPVPPLSGYVSNFHQFMDLVQGGVHCSTLQAPVSTITDNSKTTINSGSWIIRVKKNSDQFQLEYTQDSGTTNTQAFTLPEGEVFATNLGEQHYVAMINTGPSLPWFLSMLEPYYRKREPIQQELFLLMKYTEIEVNK